MKATILAALVVALLATPAMAHVPSKCIPHAKGAAQKVTTSDRFASSMGQRFESTVRAIRRHGNLRAGDETGILTDLMHQLFGHLSVERCAVVELISCIQGVKPDLSACPGGYIPVD